MTSENEPREYAERALDLLAGIYRAAKGIERKAGSILDEMREALNARSEDYDPYDFLDENSQNGY